MADNDLITTSKNLEIQRFSLSDTQSSMIDAHDDQISIVQFWRVLQKRRWLVAVSLGVVLVLVTVVSLLLPKRYDASARILLDLEGTDDLGLEQVVMPIGLDLNTKLETQIRIVQSDTIANSVMDQVGLQHNRDFAGSMSCPPVRTLIVWISKLMPS
jgi:uncharacterized protein involved in exopolysaccharide biosynthesis